MILDSSSSSARAREDLACVHADKDKVPYRGICPDARRLGKILSYIEYVRPYAILTAPTDPIIPRDRWVDRGMKGIKTYINRATKGAEHVNI